MNIEIKNVQETLFIPLWGRAQASLLYPNLLNDKDAVRIINGIDYDFSKIQLCVGRLDIMSFLARAYNIDKLVLDFIKRHPDGTIVNLGCGLDTTFLRIDNGRIKWYDLDLPDVIELRQNIIPATKRVTMISKSIFDNSWYANIDYTPKKGLLFIAAGLFFYFNEPDVKNFILNSSNYFHSSELFFDATSALGSKLANKKINKSGHKGVATLFHINNPSKTLCDWSKKIKVINQYPYYHFVINEIQEDKITKMKMILNDWLHINHCVHLKFLSE